MAGEFSPAADPPRTPTVLATYRSPINTVAGRIIADVSDEIPFYEPSAAPLCLFFRGLKKKRVATQRRFDHFEKDPYPAQGINTAAVLVAGVTVNVQAGEGARFRANDVVLNRNTGELVLVTVVTVDALTIVRNIDGRGAVAMAAGDELEIIGSTFEDGAAMGALRSTAETNVFNYCQIFRHGFGWSRRDATSDMYGGSDPDLELKAQGIEHEKQIERSMLFGGRFLRTGAGGHEQTGSGGLDYFVTTNVWDLGNTEPTERQFVTFMEQAMRYGKNSNVGGGGSKLFIGSRRWMTWFDKIARDRVRYVDVGELLGRGRIGLTVGEFHTVHGMLTLISHPMLVGKNSGRAFVVDPAELRFRYHQGGNGFPDGNTRLLEDRQANDVDGEWLEYQTDGGLQVMLEASHSKLLNLALS